MIDKETMKMNKNRFSTPYRPQGDDIDKDVVFRSGIEVGDGKYTGKMKVL